MSVGKVSMADANGTEPIPTDKLNSSLHKGIINTEAIIDKIICPFNFSKAFKKTAPQ